jgi:hypothetical protein
VPPAGSYPPISHTVSIDPNAPTIIENCAVVMSPLDPNPSNNRSCVAVEIKPAKCVKVADQMIQCDPITGSFTYMANLTNCSGFKVDVIKLPVLAPANATMTLVSVNPALPLANGATAKVTATISGPDAVPGAVICFVISVHRYITDNMGNQIEADCCTVERKITLPRCTGDICGMKFYDLDGDRVKDVNEMTQGLGGFVIQLKDATTNLPIATTTTLSDGTYKFKDLQPGSYIVCEDLSSSPTGWQQTHPAKPNQTYTVTVQANQMVNDIDFGNVEDCLRFEFDPPICKPDGTYTLNFKVTNFSATAVSAKYVYLVPDSPASLKITPIITTLPNVIGYGQMGQGTVTISGVSGGPVCFHVLLFDINNQKCCDQAPTVCLTLDPCPLKTQSPGRHRPKVTGTRRRTQP